MSEEHFWILDDGSMHFEKIGEHEIYRPRLVSEAILRVDVENNLRTTFEPGVYQDRDVVNDILQHQFAFLDNELNELIPKLASRDYMGFVLWQYDISCGIEEDFKKGTLNEIESALWSELGKTLRRAIKYLSECMTMQAPSGTASLPSNELLDAADRCWSCCEQLVMLSILSTQTYAIFPETTTLTIHPQGSDPYIELDISEQEQLEAFNARVARDRASRSRYLDRDEMLYSVESVKLKLDPTLKSALGFSCTDALQFLYNVNENVLMPSGSFPIPFVRRESIEEAIVQEYRITQGQAANLLDAFTVRKETLEAERRVIWNPKQHYRAGSRPFFEFPHQLGPHLIWSRAMFRECMVFFVSGLPFRQLPREWSDAPSVVYALEKHGQEFNRDFEDVVLKNLRELGFSAGRYKDLIGRNQERILIPGKVGEIDVLAYSAAEQILVVADVKMVKWTSEPATFRDDLDKFIGGNKNYVTQIEGKHTWVRANIQKVARALESESDFPNEINVTKTSPIIITYFPTVASCFIEQLSCVSITELMEEFRAEQQWPYMAVDV